MEYNLLCEMKNNLDRQIINNRFKNKKIILFGYNQPSEEAAKYLEECSLKIDAVVDNNMKKVGQKIGDAMVYTPENYLAPFKDDYIILIASKYYNEMVIQLNNMGYSEERHIVKILEYSPNNISSLEKKIFDEKINLIRSGQKLYLDVVNQYNDLDKLFVIPLAKLGDAYLAFAFLRAYIRKNHIKEYGIIMLRGACSKISFLYGLDNKTTSITKENMDYILDYLRFTNCNENKVMIVHWDIYTVGIRPLGNYQGITFSDQFRYNLYELDQGIKPEKPTYTYNTKVSNTYVDNLFSENNLIMKKTVILMPYAKTSTEIFTQFWIEIADKLKDRGYCVCTNCGGNGEIAIPGTQELFFDIRYSIETVEAAGTVIGLRSGLCDVIASARCKKVILYPDRYYMTSKYMDFFSLNKMELCDDAIELIYNEHIETEEMISQVLNCI